MYRVAYHCVIFSFYTLMYSFVFGFAFIAMPADGFSQNNAGANSATLVLEGIVITATKTETQVIDTLAGVSAVTRDQFETIQPNRVSDLLDGVPGLTVQQDGDDQASAINIRGLQNFGRVNVMVDGARQNFQRSGHSANGQFYLEPELIKKVDITRGPVSTIFGSGAIGGVVNFETIDPEDILAPGQDWALHLKGRYDSNGNGFLVSKTGAYQLTPSVSILGNVVYREDDDYRDGDGNIVPLTGDDTTSALLKAKIIPGNGHNIELSYIFQDNNYITRDPDAIASTQRDTDTQDETFSVKWNYKAPANDLIDLNISAYHTTTETDQTRLTIPTPCIPPACNPALLNNERFFDIKTIGLDIYNTSLFKTGSFQHKLTYGFDIFEDTVTTDDPIGTGNQFTPSGERTVYGAFIQDQIDVGEYLQVIGALRFDSYELKGDDGSGSDGTRVSPKLTVGFTPVKGVQFFGSYAEGYRAPAITEAFNSGLHDIAFPFQFISNTSLEAETAANKEVGVNLKFDNVVKNGDGFRAKIVYFQNDVDNYINPVLFPDPGFRGPAALCPQSFIGLCFQYQNINKARLRGLELEASYDAVDWYANLAYSNIRAQNLDDNSTLYSENPDKLSATFGYRLLNESQQKLLIGARWTWVDAQTRVPPQGNVQVFYPSEEFNLVDLFAVYQHNEKFSTSLNLNNITDEQYQRYRENDPGQGFSATLTATVKFGGTTSEK